MYYSRNAYSIIIIIVFIIIFRIIQNGTADYLDNYLLIFSYI